MCVCGDICIFVSVYVEERRGEEDDLSVWMKKEGKGEREESK